MQEAPKVDVAALQMVLERYDSDHDGKLSKGEVNAWLTDSNNGVALSPDSINQVFRDLDRNGDGLVDLREMVMYMVQQQTAGQNYTVVHVENKEEVDCCCMVPSSVYLMYVIIHATLYLLYYTLRGIAYVLMLLVEKLQAGTNNAVEPDKTPQAVLQQPNPQTGVPEVAIGATGLSSPSMASSSVVPDVVVGATEFSSPSTTNNSTQQMAVSTGTTIPMPPGTDFESVTVEETFTSGPNGSTTTTVVQSSTSTNHHQDAEWSTTTIQTQVGSAFPTVTTFSQQQQVEESIISNATSSTTTSTTVIGAPVAVPNTQQQQQQVLPQQPAVPQQQSTDVTNLHVASNAISPNPETIEPATPAVVADYVVTSSSNGSGNLRALLVGINYLGTDAELHGCHNDALAAKKMLLERSKNVEIRTLLDDHEHSSHPEKVPTANNIRAGLSWLLESAKPGDKLYFHYSGHGSQIPDLTGDEADGFDETLCPLDMITKPDDPSKWLTDDELRETFFAKVPKGVDLIAVFDCCCSGTMSDVKLEKHTNANSRALNLTSSGSYVKPRFFPPNENVQQLIDLKSQMKSRNARTSREQKIRNIIDQVNVIQISGCLDSQTSADAFLDGKFTGALTYSIMKALQENRTIEVGSLIGRVRAICEELRMTQKPQLVTSGTTNEKTIWLDGWV